MAADLARAPAVRSRRRIRAGRNTTCSRCSPTRRASCMSAMCATTRWAIWSPATAARRGSTSCIRWAGTPLACRPRTPRSPSTPTPRCGPARTSRRCAPSWSAWALAMTGRARSRPATRNITATNRRCSSISSRPVSPTAGNHGSTGTRSRTPSSPTSRSSTGVAGAPAQSSRSGSWRNGRCASPHSPRNCSTRSVASTAGPSASG